VPDTYTYHPQPHHVEGISWLLAHPFSGLIMRPGLGKTACVLAARVILKKKRLGKRCLVIAPATVADIVWREEIEKWGFPLTTAFAHGKYFETVIRDKSIDVVTMTCDGVQRLYDSFTPSDIMRLFDHLIIDESTKFRTTNAKRFKLLKKYLASFARRTILTGTPAPNGYLNLFGQVFLVDRGHRLGAYITRYILEYFDPVGFGGYTKVLKRGAAKQIQKKLSDILLFIDDEALGLAKYKVNPIRLKLPPRAEKLYTELRRESVADIGDKSITAVNAAVLSNKLRQLANGAAYGDRKRVIDLHAVKVEAAVDLVEQLQGNPLLLAYEFDCDRDKLLKALGKDILVIGGSTSKAQRRKILAKFNTGDHPVLLAQGATIAHGLNLQAACHTVAWFGVPWDWEVWVQFIKRVHRLGQTKKVVVHAFIAEGTIEEGVLKVLMGKGSSEQKLLAALAAHLRGEEDAEPIQRRGRLPRKIRHPGGNGRGRRAATAVSKRRRDRVQAQVLKRRTR
jgi:SNF2 family DNA or RNA helicase